MGVLFTGIAIEVPAIYQLLAELLAQALVCGCGLVVFPICYLGFGHDVVWFASCVVNWGAWEIGIAMPNLLDVLDVDAVRLVLLGMLSPGDLGCGRGMVRFAWCVVAW